MARLQTAVLCNAASVEASGLVSMLGAFIDTVSGPALPVRTQIWIVARLLFEEADVGVDHTFEVLVEPVDVQTSAPVQPLVRLSGVARPEPTPGIDPPTSNTSSLCSGREERRQGSEMGTR